MVKHDPEWYKQLASERRERNAGRRNFQANYQRLVLEELEALKVELLKEVRTERRKNFSERLSAPDVFL